MLKNQPKRCISQGKLHFADDTNERSGCKDVQSDLGSTRSALARYVRQGQPLTLYRTAKSFLD